MMTPGVVANEDVGLASELDGGKGVWCMFDRIRLDDGGLRCCWNLVAVADVKVGVGVAGVGWGLGLLEFDERGELWELEMLSW